MTLLTKEFYDECEGRIQMTPENDNAVEVCAACDEPLEVIEDTFKDAVSVNIPGIGQKWYDVYLCVCKNCGEVVDNRSSVTS